MTSKVSTLQRQVRWCESCGYSSTYMVTVDDQGRDKTAIWCNGCGKPGITYKVPGAIT